MPAASKGEEEQRESRLVSCLAALALVNGLVLCFVSLAAMRSGALHVIDRLVVFDAAWRTRAEAEAPPLVITTRRIYEVLIFVGLLVVLFSLVGIVGARTRNRHLVCTYVVFAGAFTVTMLAAGSQTLQRRAIVEPMIDRQVADICNSTTYIRLASNIPCRFAAAYAPSEVTPCGAYCRYRASLLRELYGCQVMPRLCQQFFYSALPPEGCAAEIAEADSMMYLAAESADQCRSYCDRDIRCTAFAHGGASPAQPEVCLLGQGVASEHPAPRWSPLPPAEAAEYLARAAAGSVSCYRRGEPVVLARFKAHGWRLAVSTLALGSVLLVSTAFSICLMYNVNFKRQGLPRAAELGLMLFCPCCAGETRRKFTEPDLSAGDDSEAEAEEEAGSDASAKFS